MNNLLKLAFVALMLPVLAGCPSKPQGEVVASVNGDVLTKEELQDLVPEGFTVDRENLPKILDKWVSNTLMYREALKRGIGDEEKTKHYLKRLERDYLVNELLDRLTSSVSVSQADMLDYFNAHKDEFGDEVKMTRIVLPDSMMAEQTLAEIRAGGDFAKLAKERSQDQLLEAGQESRYFARGVGDPRQGGDPGLEEAIFSLKKGEVSNVVPTQEGYQIIKLVDRKKVRSDVSFAEYKDYIQAILAFRQSQQMVDSLLADLRSGAEVELKPDVWFE
jgi:parvulin-like peptidyl-prolyl isomerase